MDKILKFNQFWKITRKYFWLIVLMALAGGVGGYSIARFAMAPSYSSSTSLLVNRMTSDSNNASNGVTDQQADIQLISTYKNLIISDNVLDEVSKDLKDQTTTVTDGDPLNPQYETLADGTKRQIPIKTRVVKNSAGRSYDVSTDQLKKMVSVSNVQNSQVFSVNVKSDNPKMSAAVANQVADVFKNKIGNFMKINNVSIVDSASVDDTPSSRNQVIFSILGVAALGGLSVLYVLIKELTDTAVSSPEEVSDEFGLLNLGVVGHVKRVPKIQAGINKLVDGKKTNFSRMKRLDDKRV